MSASNNKYYNAKRDSLKKKYDDNKEKIKEERKSSYWSNKIYISKQRQKVNDEKQNEINKYIMNQYLNTNTKCELGKKLFIGKNKTNKNKKTKPENVKPNLFENHLVSLIL